MNHTLTTTDLAAIARGALGDLEALGHQLALNSALRQWRDRSVRGPRSRQPYRATGALRIEAEFSTGARLADRGSRLICDLGEPPWRSTTNTNPSIQRSWSG